MRRVTATFIFLCIALSLYAQNEVKWRKFSRDGDEKVFWTVFQVNDEGFRTLHSLPHKSFLGRTKHHISIRSYNPEMSDYAEFSLPSESPQSVIIGGFRDYYVITGSMGDGPNDGGWMPEDNKVVITDNGMVPLSSQSFPLHSTANAYRYVPEIFVSSDSNYLIVVNTEYQNINSLSFTEIQTIRYVDVYDKDLKHVFQGSVDPERIFGKKRGISNFYFNYYDDKLIVAATYENLIFKKDLSTLYVLSFDESGKYKTLLQKEFKYEIFDLRTLCTDEGRLIFSGYNINNPAVGLPGNHGQKCQLFYLSVDLNPSGRDPVFEGYEVDEAFGEKYDANVGKSLKKSYLRPLQLIYNNDRLFYISERLAKTVVKSMNRDATFYFESLTVMTFDSEGNIEWIKNIDKKVKMKLPASEYIQYAKAFPEEDGIRIFYYDNYENLNSPKVKPLSPSLKNRCVMSAMVTTDGKISKSVASMVSSNNVRTDLTQLYHLYGDTYLFIGKGTTSKNKGDYCGFYKIEQK